MGLAIKQTTKQRLVKEEKAAQHTKIISLIPQMTPPPKKKMRGIPLNKCLNLDETILQNLLSKSVTHGS